MLTLPRLTPIADPQGLMHIQWQALLNQMAKDVDALLSLKTIIAGELGMAANAQRIVGPLPLDGTIQLLYTVPAGTRAQIALVSASNSDAATTLSLWLVPSGGSPDASTRVVNAFPMAAFDTATFPSVKHAMSAGDAIYAEASAADAIIITMTAVLS